MGFGGSTTDSTKSTNYTPNPAVSSAATQNLNYASNLENQPFSPYTGSQVADFSPLQQQSLTEAAGPAIGSTIGAVMGAGPGSVAPASIASAMNPYLNQYVNYALQPQLQGQDQQFAAQNASLNSAATSSGAFGDARAGIEAANLTNQQNIARQGLIGNAYNSAFNTAIGAGAQDVSNNLQGQTTNANLVNQNRQMQLAAANQLQGNIGFQNALGQQGTAQTQAGLNAQYNQWLMGQQRPYQNIQALNQTEQAGAQAMPANNTQTTSSPDNSGYGILGSILGAGANMFMPGLGSAMSGMFNSSLPSGSFDGSGAFADGGEPPVGQASVVGERGPELFVPHQAGTIIPHEALQAAAQPATGAPSPAGFAHAFTAKPHVSRPRAMRSKPSLVMPKAANSNVSDAFGAAA